MSKASRKRLAYYLLCFILGAAALPIIAAIFEIVKRSLT